MKKLAGIIAGGALAFSVMGGAAIPRSATQDRSDHLAPSSGNLHPTLSHPGCGAVATPRGSALSRVRRTVDTIRALGDEAYGKVPLRFEANQGQSDGEVKFLSRARKYTLFLTAREAVLILRNRQHYESKLSESKQAGPAVLRMQFLGANPAPQVNGLEELPGKVNYFIGNDPEKWHTNVRTYAKVKYQDIYPGVDLVYYGNQGQLEYDFIIAPGVDPGIVTLHFDGTDKLEIADQGDLDLHVAGGKVHLCKPRIYQEADGIKQIIPGHYVLRNGQQVGFDIPRYDASRPLVIDPELRYSTYLGGTDADGGSHLVVNADGYVYVTGVTGSADFPLVSSVQPALAGEADVFVAKLTPDGSALVYSTYLGGSGRDNSSGIAVDSSGNAYVAGSTDSTNFPATVGSFQMTHGGANWDAFVTKLSAAGDALVYSTYLGGSGEDGAGGFTVSSAGSIDRGNQIAVDSLGNAYLTGATNSPDFPTTAGAFQVDLAGLLNAFVTKLNPVGTALVYSTYLGGGGGGCCAGDEGFGIAVDGFGNAYVTGRTSSTGAPGGLAGQPNFPTTPGVFQPTPPAFFGLEVFVTKLNPTGSTLIYSTFLGGSGHEEGFGIDVDLDGNAYVTGRTVSPDFPTTLGALDLALTTEGFCMVSGGGFGPCPDAFVTKLNAAGSGVVYSTYLGGNREDVGRSIVVDPTGNAYVAGNTSSADFPMVSPFQATLGGAAVGPDTDVFVAKLNRAGSALVYSTYLGGGTVDGHTIPGIGFGGIAIDAAGNAYVTGETTSLDFPTTAEAVQIAFGGFRDAFVAKITEPKLANISTRGFVGTGANVMIGGFVIEGTSSKQVLIRGRGPSLGGAPFNVAGALGNPFLTVFNSAGQVVGTNDNWQSTQATEILATELDPCQPNPEQTSSPPACASEAAILMMLSPGAYTVHLGGVGGATGVGLVEVFEAPN
jgi:hypothetical protein